MRLNNVDLPAAVRTNQPKDFAALHVKIDGIVRNEAVEPGASRFGN